MVGKRISANVRVGIEPCEGLQWRRGMVFVQDREVRSRAEFLCLPTGLVELLIQLLKL